MPKPLKNLGAVIRIARIARGFTQERAAAKAGVSRRQWALLERGENVSVVFLLKVAAALGLGTIPVTSSVTLTSGGRVDLDDVLSIADQLETLVERLRVITVEAMLPPSVRRDAAAIDDLIANLGPLSPEAAARVEAALSRRASDVLPIQPELPVTDSKKPAARRRRA